jgi:hypothetical protein
VADAAVTGTRQVRAMAATTARSVIDDLIPSFPDVRRRSASARRRRVEFSHIAERDLNLNRERLAQLVPGMETGPQLLGEGKWQEIFGFTPT